MPRPIELKNIDKMPKEDTWRLPPDRLYVRLGCTACLNRVCFVADGVEGRVPMFAGDPQAVQDFNDIIGLVEPHTSIERGSTSIYEPCADGKECAYEEVIEIATELLNERFGSNLTSNVYSGMGSVTPSQD